MFLPFLIYWTNVYDLKHAVCQCHGDTSGEEDKRGPHCVAAYTKVWCVYRRQEAAQSWALGFLRLCYLHHHQQDVFPCVFYM